MTPQEQVMALKESASYIAKQISNATIDATIVLGSGLKDFANAIENPIRISYLDIPHFPKSNVPGHGHQLIYGQYMGKNLLVFTGRFHYYQGIDITSVALPAWISYFLHVPQYIVTNAAGGVNSSYQVGDLVLIKDHINLTGLHPIRGVCLENWLNPFFDTSNLYNESLRKNLFQTAKDQNIKLQEGVYAFLTGPNFETPAEIQMLRTLGADLVGMSTVPETLVAHKTGMNTIGISVVTNVYPKLGDKAEIVSHEEVLMATQKAKNAFLTLMKEWIQRW